MTATEATGAGAGGTLAIGGGTVGAGARFGEADMGAGGGVAVVESIMGGAGGALATTGAGIDGEATGFGVSGAGGKTAVLAARAAGAGGLSAVWEEVRSRPAAADSARQRQGLLGVGGSVVTGGGSVGAGAPEAVGAPG